MRGIFLTKTTCEFIDNSIDIKFISFTGKIIISRSTFIFNNRTIYIFTTMKCKKIHSTFNIISNNHTMNMIDIIIMMSSISNIIEFI